MVKRSILLFTLWFHLTVKINAQEFPESKLNIASLENLFNRSNDCDNAGEYQALTLNALKLYKLAYIAQPDSISVYYRSQALMFLLDRNRKTDPVDFEYYFLKFKDEISHNVPLGFRVKFGYYINLYEYLKIKKDYSKIWLVLDSMEKLIPQYEPFMDSADQQFNPWRKMFVKSRMGETYLNENNYSQAKVQYENALSLSIKADANTKKAGYWGYEKSQLINLYNLSVLTGDNLSADYYAERLKKLKKKKSLYDRHWESNIIESILSFEKITPDQIYSIISKMTSNELLSSNPENFIRIAHFLLKDGNLSEAWKYKDKALHLLPGVAVNPAIYVQYNLLQAEIELMLCNYDEVTSLINYSKPLLSDETKGTGLFKIKGSRREYLSFMQSASSLLIEAYKTSMNIESLNVCSSLLNGAASTLNEMRLDLFDGSDRTKLLIQLSSLCENALYVYSILSQTQSLTAEQWNNLVNYIEADKSFNLFLDTKLIKAISPSEKNTFFSTKLELDKFSGTISSNPILSDSMIDKKTILIDSLQKIFKRAMSSGSFTPGIDFTQIQAKLQEDQSVIEYLTSLHFVFVLVINKSNAHIQMLQTADSSDLNLTDMLLTLGDYIKEAQSGLPLSVKEFNVAAQELFDFLIRPVLKYLQKKVIIIPEANMSTLPWTALLTEKTNSLDCRDWPFWIKTHSIATQHSLSMWLESLEQVDVADSHSKSAFAGFAPEFANLRTNKDECQKIRNELKGNVFLGNQANHANFLQYASESQIVHISSHAKANPEYKDSSFIVLAEDTLYSDEIYLNSIPADLVFLSACETGIGQIIKAEGVMSLARSFFSAGAQSVISTLWRVNDLQTSDQVIKIYRQLKQGQSKDEAIRTMQLSYLNDAKNAEKAFPYFWAGYQCQGDLKPLFKKPLYSDLSFLIFLPMLTFGLIALGIYSGKSIKRIRKMNQAA